MGSRSDDDVDELIELVTKNAGDDEGACVAAFHAAIEQHLKVPTLGHVLGERVHVHGVELVSVRRGIVGRIRKDGRARTISLLDVELPGRSKGALIVRAYQRWAGVEQLIEDTTRTAVGGDVLEAAVLKVGEQTARLRLLGGDDEITLRASSLELDAIVPGHIVRVKATKRWTHRGYLYVSGTIEAAAIDIPALGLEPLGLNEFGLDDANDGESYGDELMALWRKAVAKPKMTYEMEQSLPGAAESNWEDDPITDAVELRQRGDPGGAEKLLMDLLHVDLRCIDAHAHLGNWALDGKEKITAEKACAHYQVGIGIVEHTLGKDFDGFLPWGLVDNRPFLRCLHGYGLALWQLGRREEALEVFERVCCLNPMDNTGARFCWYAIHEGESWEELDGEGG